MPDLRDLAQQAFEKARLFGQGFSEDLGTQLGQTPEKLGHFFEPSAIPFMPPQIDAAMKVMSLIPQVEQSVSSGLGRAGVAGGKEFGLNIPDSPMGEISIGPRETLGMVAGLALPTGPIGKAGKVESIAAKAEQNIAKNLAAKAAPKAEGVVEEIIQPRLSRPGVPATRGLTRSEVEAQNLATPSTTRTVDGHTLDYSEIPEPAPDPTKNYKLGQNVPKAKPSVEVTENIPGERFVSGGDTESMVEAMYGKNLNAEESLRASTPAPGPARRSIEEERRALAAKQYEAGVEPTTLTLDDQGSPIMPMERGPAGLEEMPEKETGPYLKGTGERRSTQRTGLTRILAEPERPEGFIGPLEMEPIGEVGNAADVAGLMKWEKEIGQGRSGSRMPEKGTLEYERYMRIRDKLAEPIRERELARAGGDPKNHQYVRDYLDNMIYASQSKMDEFGDAIFKKNPDGSFEMKNGAKVPEETFDPLYKRVERDEAKRLKNDRHPGYIIKQRAPKGKTNSVPMYETDPVTRRRKLIPDWQNTPAGKQWLRDEAVATISNPGTRKNPKTQNLAGATPEEVYQYLFDEHVNTLANASHPDNPQSATGRRDIKKESRDSMGITAEGQSTDPTELEHNVTGMGQDTAHETIGGVDRAMGDEAMDPRNDRALRDIDRSSWQAEKAATTDFVDDAAQQEFFKHQRNIDDSEKFIDDLAKRKDLSEEQMKKALDAANRRIEFSKKEQARIQDVSTMDRSERTGMDQPETTGGRDDYFFKMHEPPKDVADLRRRPARTLPEGVTGTVHFGATSENPVHGPWPGRTSGSVTHTGEMPSIGMRSDKVVGDKVKDERAALQQLRKEFLDPVTRKKMSNSDYNTAARSLEESGLKSKQGVLKREGEPRAAGETVGESTKHFAKKMAEILDVVPRVSQGEMVNLSERKTWENYMEGKLRRMMESGVRP